MVIGENDGDDDACTGFEDGEDLLKVLEDSEVEDAVESHTGIEFEDILEEDDVLIQT